MHRNHPQPRKNRTNAEHDASQPMAGQPRDDEDDEELQDPDQVPSFLTARELQAHKPGKGEGGDDAGIEDSSGHDDTSELDDEPKGKPRKR